MAARPAAGAEPEPAFAGLTNLACASQGARVLFATDEWFAPASMFLQMDAPVFKEGVFTDFGKWMDGWESRRRRTPGHDWCFIELGMPGVIRGFELDTAFFTGNHVPAVGVVACFCPGLRLPEGLTGTSGAIGTCASAADVSRAEEHLRTAAEWVEVLPRSPLLPGYEDTRHNYFQCEHAQPVTHVRVNYYPDGGVARFRAYGEVHLERMQPQGGPGEEAVSATDFAAARNGGVALAWSNAHYGLPRNCLAPGRARKMDEGWETARNPRRPPVLEPGPDGLVSFDYAQDWFVLRLGARCCLEELEIDTNHFKGNFPESCLVEGLDNPALAALPALSQAERFRSGVSEPKAWRVVLPRVRCGPHEVRVFSGADLADSGPFTHLRVAIFPDGGISRFRARGRPAPAPAAVAVRSAL